MSAGRADSAILALVALGAGCSSGEPTGDLDAEVVDAAADARFDAGPPTRVSCGEAVVVVAHDPLSFRLEDAAGRELLAAPPGEPSFALATITSPRPEEYFDPRGDERVTWEPVKTATSWLAADDTATFDARHPAAGNVEIGLSCASPGHVVIDVLTLDPRDVVLSRAAFATRSEDRYLGLGEQFTGVDSRGRIRAMQLHIDGRVEAGHNDVHVPVPFLVSPRGWGLFVETRRAGAFDVGATDPDVLTAVFEGSALRLHLWVGPPLDVVAAYTLSTGAPRVPPAWAFGAHFWRNENTSGAEVLEDVARFRELDIPLSVVWIDNPWQTSYNDLTFDPARFPDAEQLIASLHDAGVKVLVWSTPYLDAVGAGDDPANGAEQLFVEAREADYLVLDSYGAVYRVQWAGGPLAGMIDFSSAAASAFWQDVVGRATGLGIDGFKLDYAEEVMVELVGVRPGLRFANGETEATMHGV
jgi:alpha-D-xyloside xylohydrolase